MGRRENAMESGAIAEISKGREAVAEEEVVREREGFVRYAVQCSRMHWSDISVAVAT